MAERSPTQLLAAWRVLERRQIDTEPDGADYDGLELEIARLRSDYHRVGSAVQAQFDLLTAVSRKSRHRPR